MAGIKFLPKFNNNIFKFENLKVGECFKSNNDGCIYMKLNYLDAKPFNTVCLNNGTLFVTSVTSLVDKVIITATEE